jgi:hypothetical protein
MTAPVVEARRPIDRPADDGFEVSYVAGDGAEHRVPLAHAWAVPFEQGIPVRRFPSRQGQRHLSGWWWSATTGGHVGFESWLERDWLLRQRQITRGGDQRGVHLVRRQRPPRHHRVAQRVMWPRLPTHQQPLIEQVL